MPLLPPQPDLARLVAHRAQMSMRLIESLRASLLDVGRPDLIPIADLIARNAGDAYAAAVAALEARRRAKRLRILTGLGRLSRLGGPRAARVARGIAEDITTSSGAFPAYRSGGL